MPFLKTINREERKGAQRVAKKSRQIFAFSLRLFALFAVNPHCCCKRTAGLIVFLSLVHSSFAQDSLFHYHKAKLIYKDNFDKDLKNWIIETQTANDPKIELHDSKLKIEVTGGTTAWFNKKLSGNYLIEFKRKVIVAGGTRDRLSDLNMFWAASDRKNANLFTRTGILEEYDSLKLYYVGMGGNSNRTTRFRKYQGNGERSLLNEYIDKEHLLEANKEYFIQIVMYDGTTELFVNGEKFFSYKDQDPLTEGYFGIRTTKSNQEVDDFKVYRLKQHK